MPDRADLDLLTQAQRNAVTAATEQLDEFFARAATWSADEVAAGAAPFWLVSDRLSLLLPCAIETLRGESRSGYEWCYSLLPRSYVQGTSPIACPLARGAFWVGRTQ